MIVMAINLHKPNELAVTVTSDIEDESVKSRICPYTVTELVVVTSVLIDLYQSC